MRRVLCGWLADRLEGGDRLQKPVSLLEGNFFTDAKAEDGRAWIGFLELVPGCQGPWCSPEVRSTTWPALFASREDPCSLQQLGENPSRPSLSLSAQSCEPGGAQQAACHLHVLDPTVLGRGGWGEDFLDPERAGSDRSAIAIDSSRVCSSFRAVPAELNRHVSPTFVRNSVKLSSPPTPEF